MTLEIPDDLRERLTTSASRRNQTPTEYALSVLEAGVPAETVSSSEPLPATPAEAMAYWEKHGLVGEQWAEREGIGDTIEYARGLRSEADEPMPETGPELVAYWRRHGVIGAWAERDDITDSLEFARELRRRAETRQEA